jgi:hypothetical protein
MTLVTNSLAGIAAIWSEGAAKSVSRPANTRDEYSTLSSRVHADGR